MVTPSGPTSQPRYPGRYLASSLKHWADHAIQQRRGSTRFALETAGLRRGALPDFVVIGAMKAGTTSMYDWLTDHPLVMSALEKEVHFFDFHFPRGVRWYRSQMPRERACARHGASRGRPALACEASPTYLYHPLAARRAREVIPDAKFVVLLRDPVMRAYSHYQTGLRHYWEALSFEDALDREEIRLEGEIDSLLKDQLHHRSYPRYRWSYQSMGHYAEQLETWFQHFDRRQFHFVVNESLDREPQQTFEQIYDFLELPHHPLQQRERLGVGTYEPIRPETRQRLQDYFRPHNERLRNLIGLDVDWGY